MHPLDLIDIEDMLDEEERAIRDVTRGIVDDIVRPKVAMWWEEGDVPARELMAAFGEAGLLGMHLDGYGCAGTTATTYGLAAMELEAGDSGIRSMVSVQGSLAMYAIHRFGSPEQRERWLPDMARGTLIGCFGLTEADAGSNPASMRTHARKDGSDWLLSGSKMWITNGSVADIAIVWARTDHGVRGFIVPTDSPGFQANVIHHKVSLRASVTSELVFDDVRLPEDALLPEATSLGAPLRCLNEARFGIAFGTMGAARECLETALAYAAEREQFDKPIAGFQLTQRKLVDMSVELSKGMLLALRLGRLKDAGKITPEQVSAGKLNNAREALAIARECRAILGGSGITLEYPVIRHMNNLESVFTYEGTNEMHTLVIGAALTGIQAFR
ncbi:acyl-CoA dehydrogenase family protein [Candidatus Nanopelagicales bacterium]|jgi:glutaryl-CoA dehydrogenase|nr:acyl-CoA dehydrogenase family protein [Candidatus Nanopelagicales bacterium]